MLSRRNSGHIMEERDSKWKPFNIGHQSRDGVSTDCERAFYHLAKCLAFADCNPMQSAMQASLLVCGSSGRRVEEWSARMIPQSAYQRHSSCVHCNHLVATCRLSDGKRHLSPCVKMVVYDRNNFAHELVFFSSSRLSLVDQLRTRCWLSFVKCMTSYRTPQFI